MKFMLQVRFNGADAAISRLPVDEQQTINAEFEAIRRLPGVLDGNQLQPMSTATIVDAGNRRAHSADLSSVGSSGAIDGYYLYDAADLEAAIALAERIPATKFGASVEVRAVVER